MAHKIKNCFQSLSRRTLSVILSAALLASMFVAVLSGLFVSLATNFSAVEALNQVVPVQYINLLPVSLSDTTYVDETSGVAHKASSRTTLDASFQDYVSYSVSSSESVTMTMKKTLSKSSANTYGNAYVQVYSKLHQQINIQENPWLYLRFTSTSYVNGYLYITFSKITDYETDGDPIYTVYGKDGTELDDETALDRDYAFAVSFADIITYSGDASATVTGDLYTQTNADYTVDAYSYLYSLYSGASFWPDWENGEYMTVVEVSHALTSSKNTDLESGRYVSWWECGLGRSIMSRPASLLPRSRQNVKSTDDDNYPTGTAVSTDGRGATLDDGTAVFRNGATDGWVELAWQVRRYFNVAELRALMLDFDYECASGADFELCIGIAGNDITMDPNGKYIESYSYLWNNCYVSNVHNGGTDLINDPTYSNTAGLSIDEKYRDATLDVYSYCLSIADAAASTHSAGYRAFYPDDHLIYVGTVYLRLPASSKLTMYQLEFQVSNDAVSSTTADTAYPWVSDNEPDSVPPTGTPATSSVLNNATGVAYAWVTEPEDAPIVASKTDLLSMADQETQFIVSDHTASDFLAYDSTVQTNTKFWRTTDGETYVKNVAGGVQARTFRRTRGDVTETSSGVTNYLLDLDLDKTPFLYYSYELINDGAEGDPDPTAGIYFKFRYYSNVANKGTVSTGNYTTMQYYIASSGMSLAQASSTILSTPSKMCAGATAITGCLDLRALLGEDKAQKYMLDAFKLYVTDNTTIRMTYMFLGSEALDEAATSTIPLEDGTFYSWGVSKADFEAQTDSESSDATVMFANKVDLLQELQDRKIWNLRHLNGSATDVSQSVINSGLGFYDVDSDTGAVTLRVGTTASVKKSGGSFDHLLELYNASDSTSLENLRYLNYSVTASAGMRWSLIFVEADGFSTSDAGVTQTYQGAAIRSWNDDVTVGNNTSYMRDITISNRDGTATNYYSAYWDPASSANGNRNATWYLYSVPGSESGCIDLSNCDTYIDWHDILSVYLVAYKDPNIRADDGTTTTDGFVSFNYIYLTSEPLTVTKKTPAVTAGTRYSWAATQAPAVTANWSSIMSESTVTNTTSWVEYNLTSNPYTGKNNYNLYYSYKLVPKSGVNTAVKTPTARLVVYSNSGLWSYVFRSTKSTALDRAIEVGNSTGSCNANYCEDAAVGINTEHGVYKPQGSETACISLNAIGCTDIYAVRIFYDTTNYDLQVQYLFVDTASSTSLSLPSAFTESSAYTAYTDFSDVLYEEPNDNILLLDEKTTLSQGTLTYNPTITVDLSQTPYLYYSIEYPSSVMGTFGLSTKTANGKELSFFRDASLPASDGLIRMGVATQTSEYMLQSETGCVDVYSWYYDYYKATGYYTSNSVMDVKDFIIDIQSFTLWLSDSSAQATVRYLYFGDSADVTVDLIPSVAGGSLENGTDTRAWTIDNSQHSGEMEPSDDDDSDVYIEESLLSKYSDNLEDPHAGVKYTGDTNQDGYNSLHYTSSEWGFHSVCYGEITTSDTYVNTGNNRMSGLVINLNETPYLHFSITQSEGAYTTFLLQTNDYTPRETMRQTGAGEVRPWLSAYLGTSPAGQLIQIAPQSQYITYYKDVTLSDSYVTGDLAGVIDLRSWYTQTNGYDTIISLERVRFYSSYKNGVATDLTVNHFYLSSSAGASYEVTFDKNDSGITSATVSTNVLKNANLQYTTDSVAQARGFTERDGYTFVGWYTDRYWESYFDIDSVPITQDMTLYAGWLDNDDIVYGNELDFLEYADSGGITDEGDGAYTFDAEQLSISSDASGGAYSVTVPIQKAYLIEELRSIFIGIDTDRTCDASDLTLSLRLKSQGTKTYELIGTDFGDQFYNDVGTLTAATYDRELPLYTHLSSLNRLPDSGYVYIDSLTVTVQNGLSAHLRYIKAALATEVDKTAAVVAPAVVEQAGYPVIDILDPGTDPCFIEQLKMATYSYEVGATLGGDGNAYTGAQFAGISTGYVSLGSLYGLGDDVSGPNYLEISADSPYRFLYYSVSQSDNSYSTFGFYSSFVTSDNKGYSGSSYWYSFYDSRYDTFSNSSELINQSIPSVCFKSGTYTGRIDLYEYYKDLVKTEQGISYTVDAFKFYGLRLYTSKYGTEATINYLFLGGDYETTLTEAKASYVTQSGEVQEVIFSENLSEGQGVTLTLDSLRDSLYASDSSKLFKGWSFNGEDLVYWNLNATNDREYTADNPNGAWTSDASIAQANGFVANLREITYQLNETTAVVYPMWDSEDYSPLLTVNTQDNGQVEVLSGALTPVDGAIDQWHTVYGQQFVLRATATKDTDAFLGWYDDADRLISSSRDLVMTAVSDTVLTAKFGSSDAQNVLIDTLKNNKTTVVWLRAGDESLGQEGTEFYLTSVNGGEIAQTHQTVSGITQSDGVELLCYWEIEDSQLLMAVAPDRCHWEQLLADGSTLCLGDSQTFTFVASVNIELVCVPNNNTTSTESAGDILMNEIAVCYDRSPVDATGEREEERMVFIGQVLPYTDEEIVSCGIVMVDREARAVTPSVGSDDCVTLTSYAWNSTTGQFAVEFPVGNGQSWYVRSYTIVRNTQTGEYTLRYGAMTAMVV